MENYINLAIGAPRRLAILRREAENLIARGTRAANPTWRTVRYATLKSETGLQCGANDGAPVWYCHGGAPFGREWYCDEIPDGPRIDHTGWFTDPDGDETARGIVAALPHGRFIAGYEWSGNGERVYFPRLYDSARDAALAADGEAESFAETEREYQTRWRAAGRLRDEIGEKETRLIECLALRNNPRFRNVRREIPALVACIRENRETLASDYSDIEE